MLYLLLKTLHILGVVMFLGNITTGILWKDHADRTRDPRLMAHAIEGIILSDRLFTIPGVLLIVVAGITAAIVGGHPILRTGWILWPIILFSVSGMAFGRWVAPLQRQMASLMKHGAESGSPDWAAYDRLSRAWAVSGAVALIAPAVAVVIMVVKPALPAF